MKHLRLITLIFLTYSVFLSKPANAQSITAESPGKKLKVTVSVEEGKLQYTLFYGGIPFIERSPLGLHSSIGDFSEQLSLIAYRTKNITDSYLLDRSKTSRVTYRARQLSCSFRNVAGDTLLMEFNLSDNDLAFRYIIPENGKGKIACTIESETTGFRLPAGTTTFITPQAPAASGWKKSKPSYEEEYTREEPAGTKSKYGLGYTFPALFHLGNKGWLLLSETGIAGNYPGTRLSDASNNTYYVAFPMPGENNGQGATTANAALPMTTSWKTLTVGADLQPIITSTAATDVVKPVVSTSLPVATGRATWSWIVWQDASCNYDDQISYIDLAAKLNCEFVLIDALWDVKIGKAKITELVNYAKTKGVGILLWYNSNGNWNEAPQTPLNRMNTAAARAAEMKWLQSIGVKGIKVDFFGGDKQETMALYHNILTDAARYGLSVNFHGATLPRGWERMYPNFVSSEAVLASENLVFSQAFSDNFASTATIYPFTRNAVASMDFGPVFLNERLDRTNKRGTIRRTTDAFEIATSVIFFSAVQHWAVTPQNLTGKPGYLFEFLREVPTVWDESRLIDGYPGKYCILARRKGKRWYIAAINGGNEPRSITVKLPMLKKRSVRVISDGAGLQSALSAQKINKKGSFQFNLSPNGGTVIYTP
jgi:hypothetical protein